MTKKDFTTVTTFSKILAMVMFVSFPFIGFYLGRQFQKALDRPYMNNIEKTDPKTGKNGGSMCTLEALKCPDGSYVGRSGQDCEFEKCPGEN